jgi:hypothetical protein
MEYITARAQPTPKTKPRKNPMTVPRVILIAPMMSCPESTGSAKRPGFVTDFASGEGDEAQWSQDHSSEKEGERKGTHRVKFIG